MKNAIMTICLAVVMCASIGCDSKPTTFDHLEGNWKLWREGTIARKKIEIRTRGTTEKRIFILEFKDGVDVKSTRIHEYSKINEGESGRLYCWNGIDHDNTYMWVPVDPTNDVALLERIKKLAKEWKARENPPHKTFEVVQEPVAVAESEVKKQDWKNIKSGKPPFHQTVLIEFKDGLTTTAYYTPEKKWKIDTDRKKMSGGIALKDVAKWKFIDLE